MFESHEGLPQMQPFATLPSSVEGHYGHPMPVSGGGGSSMNYYNQNNHQQQQAFRGHAAPLPQTSTASLRQPHNTGFCCTPGGKKTAVMSFVGAGGSYVQETTYRYVGPGGGEFEVAHVQEKDNRGKCCLATLAAAALLGLLIFLVIFMSSQTTTTTFVTYQCDTNPVLWSTNHREVCCQTHGVACVNSKPYDCDAGLTNFAVGWSTFKKEWCCNNEQKGCKTDLVEIKSYDCDAGLSNWAEGWSDGKKAYCCEHHQKGCARECITGGCDATCYHDVDGKGHGHVTCRDRVTWAKDHAGHSLLSAIGLVSKECHCQCACTESTFQSARAELKTCLLFGDPHILTFDGSRASFYGEGQVWIVKSESVEVQARYLTVDSAQGLTATHDIAFGGDFLKGHVLKVGPLNGGSITWDNNVILSELGSTFDPNGMGKVWYDNKGQLTDAKQDDLKRIVHIDFPGDFYAQIYRWENHLNVRIRMPQVEGQDGHCGNFNGQPYDDDHSSVVKRIGHEVDKPDLLFNSYTPRNAGPHLSYSDCPEHKRDAARAECQAVTDGLAEKISNQNGQKATGTAQDILHGCIFDVCFAGRRYAQSDEIEGW
mmetsp:Transcript_26532/g.57608  ORF Transcript_26532/g.57608 Transcript_26532/m.57608 type:complete len:596 (-) Transcript_26532:290-2077(-)